MCRRALISAGVAQLVERQPSKLNVASSNLVSRSVIFGVRGLPNPRTFWQLASFQTAGVGLPNPRTGLRLALSRAAGVSFCFAHLAQLVEHVLGKDEVTSSILVVGSKRLGHAPSRALPRMEPSSRTFVLGSSPSRAVSASRAFRPAVAAA